MVVLNVRVSDELSNYLVKTAKYFDISKSYLVRKAIESYMQELQEEIEDYNDALKISAKNNKAVSWDEVMRDCGLEN